MLCKKCGDEIPKDAAECQRCATAELAAAMTGKLKPVKPARQLPVDPRPLVSALAACLLLLGCVLPILQTAHGGISLYTILCDAQTTSMTFTTSLPVSLAPPASLLLLLKFSAVICLGAGVGAIVFTFIRWDPALPLFGILTSLFTILLAHGYYHDYRALTAQIRLLREAMIALNNPVPPALSFTAFAITPIGIALLFLALGSIALFTAGALPDHRTAN